MTQGHKKFHYEFIDMMRGFAILLMFIYHFSYDLDYFGFIQQAFLTDPFWINFRSLIVTLFLVVMGASLYLASYRGLNKKRYQRRLGLLIFYALLVSLATWFMFPRAMVFFGILHFIAVASVLGLLFTRLGIINLFLGIGLVLLGQFYAHPLFDQPWLQWFGLVTTLPVTVDYVPLLPWFGMVLIGMYLGEKLSRQGENSFFRGWKNNNALTRTLALGGRHSLHIYMLHQPLFLGILYIISELIK